MADWSALVKGFQEGADFRQRFRANRQFEKARDQALERGNYDLESQRAFRKTTNPDAAGVLGDDYAMGNTDWGGKLEDPFAFKLFDWFKKKVGGGKKKKALDLGGEGEFSTSNPVGTGEEDEGGAQTYPYDPGYADGGEVSEEEKIRERARQNRARNAGRVENATENVRGADRTAQGASRARRALDVAKSADDKLGKFTGRAAEGSGVLRRAAAGAKRLGTAGALAGTAIQSATTPTEDYRERFGLETNDPSFLGDVGVRALGAASDLGSILTFGAADRLYRDKQRQAAEAGAPQQAIPVDQAPQEGEAFPEFAASGGSSMGASRRSALPSQSAATEPDVVDFSNIDIDAKDVPDMKTDDWKRYRAEMIAAAQKSGNPQAVAQVNDMVTEMQMKGFLSYGQQGLALQQAGNARGAMAAYRAAFQYFPNGNDVEFGTAKNKRTGRTQIIGFGKDEKTGKVVPGTELIMDPERVGVLLENFKNPQAFRMWTKDWRDFQQEQQKYQEVTKPLAQAQADYMANNSEARMLAAENQALRLGQGGAGAAANMRNAERVFRERLGMMGLQDEPQADYLASIMSQVKAKNPNVPDNTIVQVIMAAQQDGSLQQRLQRMGIAPMSSIAAPPGASMQMPPGVDPEAWNDPEVAALPYDQRVMASTPAR